ncbi:serine dehydratase beta chain [Alkalilacustris brevis]|uniref:serine dehydratase beta chain n=1 Tax=Alkalilacustris brevis TaxID=2026338 RepID=UPI001EE3C881|nr:serine dehydratase beta chain [Alkalilacustris brevis]
MAADARGDTIDQQIYYSVGGGFVVTEEELAAQQGGSGRAAPCRRPKQGTRPDLAGDVGLH